MQSTDLHQKSPILIGITGGSGSGKTTFIHAIRERFSQEELCILSLDNYYYPREKQKQDPKGVKNFDLPSSIDHRAFQEDLQKLLDGKEVTRMEYTFNNPLKEAEQLHFKPAPVIIAEGLFIFKWEELRDMMDLKIFIQAKENLKVIRRILRDRVERNYPLDDVLYRYQHHVLPTYEKHIRPYIDESDIVINNNDHFRNALEVVCGFIRNHLRECGRSNDESVSH